VLASDLRGEFASGEQAIGIDLRCKMADAIEKTTPNEKRMFARATEWRLRYDLCHLLGSEWQN